MDPFTIGTAILGLFGTLVASQQQRDAQREANETNIRLQRESQEHAERMWNLNNAYNTPANQVQRLIDANLNPDLMYNTGVSNTSQSPAATVEPAKVDPLPTLNPFQSVSQGLDLALKRNQLVRDNIDTDNYGTRIQNELAQQEADIQETLSNINVNNTQINVLNESINEIRARTDLTEEQKKTQEQETLIKALEEWEKEQTVEWTVKEAEQKYNLSVEEVNNARLQAKVLTAQTLLYQSQAAVNYAEVSRITKLTEKEVQHYDAQNRLLGLQADREGIKYSQELADHHTKFMREYNYNPATGFWERKKLYQGLDMTKAVIGCAAAGFGLTVGRGMGAAVSGAAKLKPIKGFAKPKPIKGFGR